jgi:hypothetical protein
MPQADAHRWSSDQGLLAAWILELREVRSHSAAQRAAAERQRVSAIAMRDEAHEMRARMRRESRRAR